ncbi:MAG: hypothetical protein NTX33_06400 [Propionibacteriales bacterium]|nr:hypothetical protein [Propionibacteriales bacterium]
MAHLGKPLVVRLVAGAVAIFVVVAVAYLFTRGEDEVAAADAPEVGECLAMSGTLAVSEHEEKDCGDAAAAYVVTSDKGGCDKAAELPYKISSSDKKDGDLADLCLDLNASEGDCFTLKNAESFSVKIACDEAEGDPNAVRIVSIGKSADQCVTGTQPRKNATRDTLLCLGPAT